MDLLWTTIVASETLQLCTIIFLGLFIGSFLNVLNSRLPMMEDYKNAFFVNTYAEKIKPDVAEVLEKNKGVTLSFPASRCPICGHKIKFYENIPILSYLFLRGKCSGCETHISMEYPLVEFLNGALWTVAYFHFGFTLELLFALPMITLLLSLSVIDIKEKIIFDTYHLLILSLGLLNLSYADSGLILKDQVLLTVCFYFGFYLFISGYEKLRRVEYGQIMFGRGDIKLYGAMAIWLPLNQFIEMVLLSSIIGLCLFFIIWLMGSMVKELRAFKLPLAPSIALAFSFVFITGGVIL
jgi:leader peptidase (prepilin peptidase)/N-methyltransferase